MAHGYVVAAVLILFFGCAFGLPLWNALQAPNTMAYACNTRANITLVDYIHTSTDSKGNIWLFQGRDSCSFPVQLRYFDITENIWKIEWDATLSAGPRRTSDNALWIDKNDNIWIYGGYSSIVDEDTVLCDFWMYNISTKSWTDLTPANTTMNFGEKGVPSDTTYPGCRQRMAAWYTADDNSLWTAFGLISYTWTSGALLSPMWQYQIDLGQWMWHSGPETPVWDSATQSESQIAVSDDFSFDNYPGGRWGPFFAKDDDNNFWLFGGESFSVFSDMWVFNRASGWKFLGGNISSESYLEEPTPVSVNGQFSANIWPPRASVNSLAYAGNGVLAMLVTFLDFQHIIEEDWYYDIETNQWARTYNNSSPLTVANVLRTPDESTRPGGVYFTRTTSRGKIWAIGSISKAVMVKDLDNGAFICELNPVCHADATCVTGTGCVCNEGFEGTGRGLNGCSAIPMAPVSPAASPSAQPGSPSTNTPRTSGGASLLLSTSLLIVCIAFL